MPLPDPDLRRTWLFGPGADTSVHEAMLASGADALIIDLDDFTPPTRRPEARAMLAGSWMSKGSIMPIQPKNGS
jgi:citrate lyase subunit beta / citryl-CoA lyase